MHAYKMTYYKGGSYTYKPKTFSKCCLQTGKPEEPVETFSSKANT